MTTRAFFHPMNCEVDLARLSPHVYEQIVALHGKIRLSSAPVLTCLGNGKPMHVYRHPLGRYFVRHFSNGHSDGHVHNQAIARMSDEHRRQADYTLRAATDHGLDAQLEVSTGNGTRLDVGVIGQVQIGFEIQRSGLSLPHARSRATKSFCAGWPTAWITDSQSDPGWADWVPTARLEVRNGSMGWSEALPPRNTQRVVIGHYSLERDRDSKTGFRYIRSPESVLLDELAYLMPAGQIIPVAVGKKGRVDLAFQTAASVIDSCTYEGASVWTPVKKKVAKELPQAISRDCTSHADAAKFVICTLCNKDLLARQSKIRGYCEECRIALNLPSSPQGAQWAG